MTTNANRNYARLVLAILAAWLGTAIAASRLLVFHAGSPYAFDPPVPLGIMVTLPILAFVIWYAASSGFRQFVLSLKPQNLTLVQTWRIGSLRLWNSAGSFRASCGLGRLRHRCHGTVCGNLSRWQCRT